MSGFRVVRDKLSGRWMTVPEYEQVQAERAEAAARGQRVPASNKDLYDFSQ